MPKVTGAKTKSAPKITESSSRVPQHSGSQRTHLAWAIKYKRKLLYGIGIGIALLAVLAPAVFYKAPTARLDVAGHSITLEIAHTDAERQAGLSGRDTMAENQGMVFTFEESSKQCFWMKDMKFNLDIIFLDSNHQIVKLYHNLSPQSYPKSYCASDTRYVIELNAGQSAKLGLNIGQRLSI
ncbi:MAG: DUF192 domain-containing protein [Candidatus Saccharimonadales bacterium]